MKQTRWRRTKQTGATVALVALVAAACGTPGEGTDDTAGDPPTAIDESMLELYEEMTPSENAEEVDTTQFATDTGEPLQIGFAGFGLVNSWRVQALESTRILADELGVELVVTDAGGDATQQMSDTEDLLAQGVDALLISPVAPEPLAPVIERAHDTGIPVIVWGSEADTDRYTANVIDDAHYFGLVGAQKLAEDMGGEGNVIMLRGIAGNSVETQRYEGAVEALSNYPDIEIIAEEYGDWAFDQGKTITENLLAAHEEIDGVWSSGATMTQGAIEAFQEADRELVPMSGENLNGYLKDWAELGLDGSAPLFPTWQAPEALKLAVRALQGLPIQSSYLLQPEPIVDAEAAVLEDISDDYWVEQYLEREEIEQIFPN